MSNQKQQQQQKQKPKVAAVETTTTTTTATMTAVNVMTAKTDLLFVDKMQQIRDELIKLDNDQLDRVKLKRIHNRKKSELQMMTNTVLLPMEQKKFDLRKTVNQEVCSSHWHIMLSSQPTVYSFYSD